MASRQGRDAPKGHKGAGPEEAHTLIRHVACLPRSPKVTSPVTHGNPGNRFASTGHEMGDYLKKKESHHVTLVTIPTMLCVSLFAQQTLGTIGQASFLLGWGVQRGGGGL